MKKRLARLEDILKGGPGSGRRPEGGGQMNRGHAAVFDRSGKLLGRVGKTATSIGASKVAGGPVEYANHPVHGWGWRKK